MNSVTKYRAGSRALVSSLAMFVLILEFGIFVSAHAQDFLYIGDGSDNTVKRFNADTGEYLGEFVRKGNSPVKGPRGPIFNSEGDLLLSNQDSGANKYGEILKFDPSPDGTTGEFLGALVPHNDPNAPFAPRGIVLNDDVLFVADQLSVGKNDPPGRLLAYTGDGTFLADLTPDHNTQFPGAFSTDEFHPRGVVLGPDGLLYVSVVDDLDPKSADYDPLVNPLAGWILRFDPTNNGAFVDVFVSNTASNPGAGCTALLYRPEGLVFGADGKLYVTAFRRGLADHDGIVEPDDTDKILVFDESGACVDRIDLDEPTKPGVIYDPRRPRAFAQAILFGPGGYLFVPINGNGPDTGAVRRYDVSTKEPTNFVLPSAQGGPLGQPWYLTFGQTNPATLEYMSRPVM